MRMSTDTGIVVFIKRILCRWQLNTIGIRSVFFLKQPSDNIAIDTFSLALSIVAHTYSTHLRAILHVFTYLVEGKHTPSTRLSLLMICPLGIAFPDS